jgi:ribosomal protein S18 acetylase RimI-like enzyme
MLGAPGMFLENIFVKPEWRGMGVGEALLGHLAVIAEERGYMRIDWRCLVSNEPAIGFYTSQGAVALSDWTGFRMDAAAIHDISRKTQAKEIPTNLYEHAS